MDHNGILPLEKFDCEGDSTSVGVRWERWKKGLLIYFEALGVTDVTKKRALLLYFGGMDLQEIYCNIPGANVEPAEDVDVFAVALSKLDDYFAPKQGIYYERHVLRLISQGPDEKFEKFVLRLRQQAWKCRYKDKEEHIIDQVIEKCSSNELRKKILKMGDEISLDKIILEANSLEVVNKQMEDFTKDVTNATNGNQSVNKIDSRKKPTFYKNHRTCGRCGNRSHASWDINCPAREKDCLKCGLKGHFRQFCKTRKIFKRRNEDKPGTEENKRKKNNSSSANQVNEVMLIKEQDCKEDKINYVFHIDDDSEFECTIGGVKVSLLVDSGCKQNLLTEETWKKMKENNVRIFKQVANPDIKFVAYGSNMPLKVIGSFEANIQVGTKTQSSIFYVIANGTRNLLGKLTAMSLGILKIGLDLAINNVVPEKRDGKKDKPMTDQMSSNNLIFPKFKNVQVEIPVDESVPAVSQPYRRIPIPLEGKVEAKINELVEKDIIEQVQGSSKWVSPIVPILKDNGEVRLCVDMRRANAAIVRENHPLPTMDKLLPKMRNAKFFTKLDIKDAFHQIELNPNSRHITTFISSKGLFRYKRLMFGISCAPEIFQKTIERMLVGCQGVVNFIDDILVYATNLEEHDARLKKVMGVLKENNVVLREDKCIYRVNKVNFLGHELSAEGVRPLQKYITTIQEFRSPTTVGELQSFLGLVNYVSKWIPDFATVTEPLKELLRNKTTNTDGSNIQKQWTPRQQKAFESLKSALSNIPTLGYYNVSDQTVVIADASPVGLGAVLIQIDHRGPRIIAYGHKTLTECERRYCQTEKEALALVWSVEHFHIFLCGKEFDLITDHKPLEVIFGPKSKPCARIERWILRLQGYKYKVIYRPGKSNIADPISRLCKIPEIAPKGTENYIHQIVECTRPVAVSIKEIIDESIVDEETLAVKEGLYNNKWIDTVKTYKMFKDELCFYEGILLRGTKIVIPKKLRDRVLEAAHEGHPGIVSMKTRMRTKVWWPKCDKDAENKVKSCKGCTLVSGPNPPHPMKRRELPEEPWTDIAIDLLGPLPSGHNLLVVVDYYSRYKEVKICQKITSSSVLSILKEIFSRLGNPLTITADNGRQFVSDEFKLFCKERNIALFSTVPYWPQQNGEVERQNRDILKRLKISQTEKKDWKESLLEYLTMYNSTPHSVTGKTPSELFFKRRFRDKLPMIGDIGQLAEDMEVRDRDRQMKEKGKEYADRKRKAQECELQPGDKVYVKNMIKDNKLSLNYNPSTHTVQKATGGDIEVRNDETGQLYRRNVVHLKKVEGKWRVLGNEVDEGEMDYETNTSDSN